MRLASSRAAALAVLLLAPPSAAGFHLPASSSRHAAAATPAGTRAVLATRRFSSVVEAPAPAAAAASSSGGRKLNGPVPYSDMTVGVVKETYPGENRVSVAPDSAKTLVDAGLTVVVEEGGACRVVLAVRRPSGERPCDRGPGFAVRLGPR